MICKFKLFLAIITRYFQMLLLKCKIDVNGVPYDYAKPPYLFSGSIVALVTPDG